MNVAFFRRSPELFSSGSARDVALARREGLENGIEPFHGFLGPPDHHAVTALQAPHAAAGPNVDIVDASAFQLSRSTNVILEIGVAAVDDGVASLHVLC